MPVIMAQWNAGRMEYWVSKAVIHLANTNGWKLPDAFQAALAKHHKTILTTRNIKDFDPAKFDFIEFPYSL